MKLKLCLNIGLLMALIAFVSAAQNRYGNPRASTNRNRNNKNEPIEQGRTLGLLGPIIGLGLNRIRRPFGGIGFDAPIVPAGAYRPTSSTSATTQSDPYYGGYNGYGGYPYNYYGGYNNYPYYRPYRPVYQPPFFGGYRPLPYPNYYGGYPQYNNYASQRPQYNYQRPNPISQPSSFGQQTGANSLAVPARPASTTTPIAGSGTTNPQINSAQAAQVANLLGQLLGQQLRPLLNQGTAAAALDTAYDSSSSIEDKRYRPRHFK